MKTINQPLSVFLIDDDKMYLSSLKYDLNEKFKSDIRTSTFTTGEACMNSIQGQPDIVVLDYFLNNDEHPDAMDGLQVLKKIKSSWRNTMVIMLSGQDKLQVAADCIQNGAYEYVTKTESAFVRMENVIKNVIYKIRSDKESKTYAKWNYIMGAFFLILFLIEVVYFFSKSGADYYFIK